MSGKDEYFELEPVEAIRELTDGLNSPLGTPMRTGIFKIRDADEIQVDLVKALAEKISQKGDNKVTAIDRAEGFGVTYRVE